MFLNIFCLQEVDWVYQQTRDSSKVLAVVGGLDLVKHDKMKEAIARFSRSKGPRFVGVRYLLVWDEEDYLTREDVHQGEETFVTFQLIIYYLKYKDSASCLTMASHLTGTPPLQVTY